ncbi:unnamed protein product [Merluccius merluccius]
MPINNPKTCETKRLGRGRQQQQHILKVTLWASRLWRLPRVSAEPRSEPSTSQHLYHVQPEPRRFSLSVASSSAAAAASRSTGLSDDRIQAAVQGGSHVRSGPADRRGREDGFANPGFANPSSPPVAQPEAYLHRGDLLAPASSAAAGDGH